MEEVYPRQSKNTSVRNHDVTWRRGRNVSWHKEPGPPPLKRDSPVKWGVPFDQLTPVQREHAWFTDGSAKYVSERCHWKAVAYNPLRGRTQMAQERGQSSQYAKLYAVFQALQQKFEKKKMLLIYSFLISSKWFNHLDTSMDCEWIENCKKGHMGKGCLGRYLTFGT